MKKVSRILTLISLSSLIFTGCENNAGKNIVVSPNIIVGGAISGGSSSSTSGNTTKEIPTTTPSPSVNSDEIKKQIEKLVKDNVNALNNYDLSSIRGFFHPSSQDWQKQVSALESYSNQGITLRTEILGFEYKDVSENTVTAIVNQKTIGTSTFGEQAESTGQTLATFKKEGDHWYIDTVTNR
jgi:ketosteroid isomerase-like protein